MRLTGGGHLKVIEHHTKRVRSQRLIAINCAAQPEAMKLAATRRSLGINAAAGSTQMIARTTRGLRQLDDCQRRTASRATSAGAPRRGTVGQQFCREDSRHVWVLSVEGVESVVTSSTTRQSSQCTSGSSPARAM